MYERLFQSVLYPTYERIRGRDTARYLREYRANQWLTPERLSDLQATKIRTLIDHCAKHVPYYQKQWSELGIDPASIKTAEDLEKLPVLTKDDIRDNFDQLVAEPFRDKLLKKSTGGSTGKPLTFGYNRDSHDRRTAVMWRGYEWAGSVMGRRTVYLWGTAVGNPSRSSQIKEALFHKVFGRVILDSFRMTEANMDDYVSAMNRHKPRVVVAYVMPILRLAQYMLRNNLKLKVNPESILTGAEALHEAQRDTIAQAFGCPVYNTYGSREFMLIASECEERKHLHINADHLVVECVNSSRNKVMDSSGEILVTDLHNLGMPMVRYVTGDLGTQTRGICECGRALPLLKSVDGRVLDMIRSPDGRIIPGEFFPHLIKEFPAVRQFQVLQEQLDRITVKLVTCGEFEHKQHEVLRDEITKVTGQDLKVNLQVVDDIPLTSAGKHRVTISLLETGS